MTLLAQPVSDLQLDQLKIEWVQRETIKPNKYNPNKMTWHDRQLLLQSLLEDGWTQPIVTLMDATIVDGEQRWTTSGIKLDPKQIQEIIDKMLERKAQGFPESESIIARLLESKRRLEDAIAGGLPACLSSITGGLVPITRVDFGDDAHKMISTIRHNRARGSHQIDSMASITKDLVQLGLDFDDLERRLGMDNEEIRRFMQAAEGQAAELAASLQDTEFSPSVDIVHSATLMADPEVARELQRSSGANQKAKEYELQMAARKAEIEKQKQAAINQTQAETGKSLTQSEKDEVAAKIAAAIPAPPKPAAPRMEKLFMMITSEEMLIVKKALGDQWATGIIVLCEMVNEYETMKAELQKRIAAK